jgi:hypothetical protein
LPFTSTVKPAINIGCLMKFAVGTASVTGVNGLALSMEVESAWKTQLGPSIIHVEVWSIVSAGWNVTPVAVLPVMVLGSWPRPVFAIMRIRFPISTPTPPTTPMPP